MKTYLENIDSVLTHVGSSKDGLSQGEAESRLAQNGKNRLDEAEKASLWARFLAQLKDPMLIILMAAAAVSGITSLMSGEGLTDLVIIMAVVLLNAGLGVY